MLQIWPNFKAQSKRLDGMLSKIELHTLIVSYKESWTPGGQIQQGRSSTSNSCWASGYIWAVTGLRGARSDIVLSSVRAIERKKYYFFERISFFWTYFIFNPTPCCGFGIVSAKPIRFVHSYIRTSGFKFSDIGQNSPNLRAKHFLGQKTPLPVLRSMIQVSKSNKNKNYYDQFLKLFFIVF